MRIDSYVNECNDRTWELESVISKMRTAHKNISVLKGLMEEEMFWIKGLENCSKSRTSPESQMVAEQIHALLVNTVCNEQGEINEKYREIVSGLRAA